MILGKGGGASGKGSGASGKRNGASCKRNGASKERDEASHTVGGDRNRASSVCVKASLFVKIGVCVSAVTGYAYRRFAFSCFSFGRGDWCKDGRESDFHRPPL